MRNIKQKQQTTFPNMSNLQTNRHLQLGFQKAD